MRCPAPTSPLQDVPRAASLGRRLQHLATAAFINPNFAWPWWGQAISSVGDYAWDTALVLWVATFLVAAFLFGVSTTAIIVTAGPLALDSTSREFVGRVTAVINPLGRLAALVSVALAGSLVSTVLHGFHASVLGIAFGPVDTVFTGLGLLAVIGGIYTRVSLRGIEARPLPSSGEPSSSLTGADGGTQQ